MTTTYELVNDRILAALDAGVIPWRKPWQSRELGPQRNAQSGHVYRGINAVLTTLADYADPRWLTYKQAQGMGGQVRRGERGTPVVFWNWTERENAKGEIERVPFLRHYTVFNVAQIDGLTLDALTTAETPDPIAEAEAIAARYIADGGPSVTWDGNDRAYYRPATDSIHLPARDRFTSARGVYETYFHEIAHSTGHPRRLNRKGVETVAAFGSDTYSREELAAEFAAAFLMGECGIDGDVEIENAAAYIASWMRAVKDDPRLIVTAAAQGQRAADLVLGRNASEGESA